MTLNGVKESVIAAMAYKGRAANKKKPRNQNKNPSK